MGIRFWNLVAVLYFVTGISAFWRMECRGRSGLARIDPLKSPNAVSQHVHAIFGSSGFSESASYDDLMDGNCTSCAVTEDHSAYWTPPLYFAYANGSFEVVPQVGGMLAYYLLRDPYNNVSAFPEGFRMISGNSLRRNYTAGNPYVLDPPQSEWEALGQTTQTDLAQRAIGFNCLDYSKPAEGALIRHYLPEKAYMDANCTDGIRLELAFPSCWDGVNLYKSDQSHMAFPDLVQDGYCPDDYPVRLVTLFYESIFNTYAFKDEDGSFVLSNGDPTVLIAITSSLANRVLNQGFGYHGDFMMGWNGSFLQDAVAECTNMSGEIGDCPLFNIVDTETQGECSISLPQSLVMEDVTGPAALTALPGNVEIQYGPQEATMATDGLSNSVSTTLNAPLLTSSSVATSTSHTDHAGDGIMAQDVDSTAAPATITSAPTSNSDSGHTYQTVSTEYRTSGSQVDEIVWEAEVVYVTEVDVITVTATPTLNAAGSNKQRRQHHWQHAHHRHY
ncbi:hypothetical protein BX600DRAFT_498067 [Xylariales sp. PMI_506]|nr:hypothetical protein BX600DRAFT_498067 [Xylariales sp. PMI_506]